MMRHIFLGCLCALAAAIGFSLLASFFICCGVDPEARSVPDALAPLLGLFVGSWLAARGSDWRAGVLVAAVYVVIWTGFWFYLMGRWSPLLWLEEGLPRLTVAHALWWLLALLVGAAGSCASRLPTRAFLPALALSGLLLGGFMALVNPAADFPAAALDALPGYGVIRQGPARDGTVTYLLTFDAGNANVSVGLYDCDSDDARPYDDSNTSYLGQSLGALVDKLVREGTTGHRQLLCAINGGFFGASVSAAAQHEEPIVETGSAHYDVDLLRPRDQRWFFAVNSPEAVQRGLPRFSMLPDIPWNLLSDYQTVLGGVRPLRVDGKSVDLQPGAGVTTLRCSRTSLGWSADGNTLYILVVHDPDGELASQLQRRWSATQTGGWDVRQVQQFWEQKGVPSALLLDGGESTQLAFRQPGDGYHFLSSGYQYSFTLGYLFERPVRFMLPILPPSEAHRGVLNYLYVEGPQDSSSRP